MAAIRERCGEAYPRHVPDQRRRGAEGGFEVEDAAAVCQMLEAAGVCAISVSAGNWYALHQTIGPMFLPRGFLVPLAATIKQAVSVPVIAVGRLDDPGLAEKILADGDADLIAIGRALIADPGPAEEVAGGKARRDPPLHRVQRVCRPRREREAGPLRRQPRGRPRGQLADRAGARRRGA